jgi:hypothetical protein
VSIASDSACHFEGIWGARVKLAGRNINRKELRHIISRIILTFIGLRITNLPYDLQTGLKIFKFNKESMTVFDKKFESRWFVDLEIYLRFKIATQRILKIWEEPLNNWEDVSGSKVRGFQLIQIMSDLFRVIQISARTGKK